MTIHEETEAPTLTWEGVKAESPAPCAICKSPAEVAERDAEERVFVWCPNAKCLPSRAIRSVARWNRAQEVVAAAVERQVCERIEEAVESMRVERDGMLHALLRLIPASVARGQKVDRLVLEGWRPKSRIVFSMPAGYLSEHFPEVTTERSVSTNSVDRDDLWKRLNRKMDVLRERLDAK